jgi:hypothetical protein
MKTTIKPTGVRTLLTITLAVTSLAFATTPTTGNAQATPAPAAAETNAAVKKEAGKAAPTQIVFVPKKMLEENKVAGKLKENTFYWSNIPDDAAQGPAVAEDNGVPYLLLKGCGDEKTRKAVTQVTLVRAYNVPAGAIQVKITAELKQTYDEWVDQSPGNEGLPTLQYSFFKNGIEARKGSPIQMPARNVKEWKAMMTTALVPAGAQQLVIVGKVDFPTAIAIASLDVSFTTDEAPKAP